MKHLYDLLPVLFAHVRVPLDLGPHQDGEAGHRGGGQGRDVGLGPEGVEDEVGEEDKVALRGPGGGLGPEDKPARVDARGLGGDLVKKEVWTFIHFLKKISFLQSCIRSEGNL